MADTIAFQVRLSRDLYAKLNSAASIHSRSGSGLVRWLIEREVERAEKSDGDKFARELKKARAERKVKTGT